MMKKISAALSRTQATLNVLGGFLAPTGTPSAVTRWKNQAIGEKMNVHSHVLQTITGEDVKLSEYEGKVLLIVNVASRCGFTPQYEGLQKLYEKYKKEGLLVLGIPSNDFLGQEPGSNPEIQQFCSSRYEVTFPLFAKTNVIGKRQHPLYRSLTMSHGSVNWNFNKFLVAREGTVLERFSSNTAPCGGVLEERIRAAL